MSDKQCGNTNRLGTCNLPEGHAGPHYADIGNQWHDRSEDYGPGAYSSVSMGDYGWRHEHGECVKLHVYGDIKYCLQCTARERDAFRRDASMREAERDQAWARQDAAERERDAWKQQAEGVNKDLLDAIRESGELRDENERWKATYNDLVGRVPSHLLDQINKGAAPHVHELPNAELIALAPRMAAAVLAMDDLLSQFPSDPDEMGVGMVSDIAEELRMIGGTK